MSQFRYPDAPSSPDFPSLEKAVLADWSAKGTFETSVQNRAATVNGNNNEYVFYDGPPFANGLPHHGHLLTGFVKDVFARYHTMKGSRVERRFGWDCHGLPAEMEAEKGLGISGRKNIMEYGIAKFNDYCRTSVMTYAGEWCDYVNRQARWVDFDNDYKTMDTSFMESVIWAFSELNKKGLIYEGFKVMPYSWAAETVLSASEIRLDDATREKEDKAVTVAFKLKDKPKGAPDAANYYLLAWTTTPWTLPSNLALAVSPELAYAAVAKDGDCYLLAASGLKAYGKELGEEAAAEISGADLVGLSYEPLFPYFADTKGAFKILSGDFIEDGSGTGVVHMAPGFGEDDQRVCADNNIDTIVPVDGEGRYTADIFDLDGLSLRGLNVIKETKLKAADEPYTDAQLEKYGLANLRIIAWLKAQGRLVKQEDYKHNYPHCWRTDQPIIYKAMSSWFVDVPQIRDRMVELNQQINWIPGHVKDGRFGKWIANAREWSISRSRFWGCPIPVWRSDNPNNKELHVFGSIAELEAFFGTKVEDLHRPFIDTLTKPDPTDPQYTIRRVEEVFDCWFESGSMPYAQVHYPFENKEWFETHFPADFIVEYEAQTRGWFYNMYVLSVALFDRIPFKNCICHGVVLDNHIDPQTGKSAPRKLSKKLKNYIDPKQLFEIYGSDALRWFMMSSSIMQGSELQLDPEGKFIHDAIRLYIKPIWNAYHFFTLYANAGEVKAEFSTASDNVMDRYILAKCKQAVNAVEKALDAYDTPAATQSVTDFIEVLNNWYIRRNKERFWGEGADNQAAYNTLYSVLQIVSRAIAPLLPMVSESIYQGLTGAESVHLADFPNVSSIADEADLVATMDFVQSVCNTALSIRNANKLKVRQPLGGMKIIANATKLKVLSADAVYADIIRDEVNIEGQVQFDGSEGALTANAEYKLKLNPPILGKRLPEKMKQLIPASKQGQWELKDGAVHIGGEVLLPEEYELNLEPKGGVKGAQALSSNDALVVLDLHVTPELEAKGLARDLIRMIQQARKDAGLHVSDRIKLVLDVPESAQGAVDTHADYISQQVLAVSLVRDNVQAAKHQSQQELDGKPIAIGFEVAA